MGYLKKYVKKYFRLFLLAVCFLSMEAACDLLQPTIMSKIVDIGIKNRSLQTVFHYGGIMLLITAFGAVCAVVRNNLSCRVSQRFGAGLRLDLFKKIHSLSYESAGRFETSTLVTRLTNDVTQTQNFVNGTMRMFVKAPLTCIGSIVLAVMLDPKLSAVIAVVVPVIAALLWINTHVGYPLFRRVQSAVDRVNGVMREYLSGVRVVKAFNRFEYEEERFSGSNNTLTDIQSSAMRVMAVFSPFTMLSINLGILVVLWLGGISVDKGSVQVGKIIAFINYMTQMSASLMMISNIFTMFVRAKASAERIGEVMNTQSTLTDAEKPEPLSGNLTVEFRNVCFAYSGGAQEPVLKNVSFSCPPGRTVGIIGTTGSGKTSLISLIPRFYDAVSGQVLIGGTDVKSLNEHELRDRIAIVPQKNTLFTGTIFENIRWGNENATEKEVREAAKTAQADEFIESFKEGYGTVLGQGGVNLSGGQKQRISIARALLRKPDILILDDCTSAVDMLTEARIRAGLRGYAKELLCFVVAQRISSVMGADLILVLDDGRLVGRGTHSELLNECAVYREIYESQYGKEEA